MSATRSNRAVRSAARLRNVLFALFVGVPLALMLSDRKSDVPFPVPNGMAGIFEFPSEFEHYFGNGFETRKPLARMHGRILQAVGTGIRTGGVLRGKDGWMFLTEAGVLQDYRREDPLPREKLERLRRRFETNQSFCNERGVEYALMIVPAKETVLTDMLPGGIEERRAGGSRTAYVQRFLQTKCVDLSPIDLVGPLRDARSWNEPYFKTDTHWNEAGALVAYRELLLRLRESNAELSIPELVSAAVLSKAIKGGNEAQILGLADEVDERYLTISLSDARGVHRVDGKPLTFDQLNRAQFSKGNLHTQCDAGEWKSAIVFHDSFGLAPIKFIGRNFRDTYFMWSDFATTAVDRIRPEVVIQIVWAGHL